MKIEINTNSVNTEMNTASYLLKFSYNVPLLVELSL